jgi:hypothetical protein
LSLSVALVGIAAAPAPGSAAQLRGFTTAPTWAFGSPQRPFISGCLDADPRACFGHFGLGPLSDVLDYRNVGQRTTIEISYADTARPPPPANVFGRRETAFERRGDWWNLTIPTARWLGLGPNQGIRYFLRDGDDRRRIFGDEIAYANIRGAAHILFASDNSDSPDASLPNFNSEFPAASFFDVFVDVSLDNFDQNTLNRAHMLPDARECTPGVDGCVADDPSQTPPTFLAEIPEPSSLALLATALAAVAVRRRRARRGSEAARPLAA